MEQFNLTVNDAVKASGISRSRLYEALKAGNLKARKAGRRTLIETAELKRFVADLPKYDPAA
jgi:excisionase family DNA binding protein